MKKFLSLFLCCLLLVSLFAACKDMSKADNTETTVHSHEHEEDHNNAVQTTAPLENQDPQQEDPQSDEHDHYHVNFKGLTGGALTIDDFVALEGRACDFEFETAGTKYYVYNDVTFGEFVFDQVQISFSEGTVRVSCTKTDAATAEDTLAQWSEAMTTLAGGPAVLTDNGNAQRWADHSQSYVLLTQLNEETVQLCFYLVGE